MPTYTYLCEECGRWFDKRTTVSLRDAVACPDCDGITERVFTPTNMIVIPGHFKLDRTWAEPPPGDPAWETMSPPHARARVHQKKVPTLKSAFDDVKQWE